MADIMNVDLPTIITDAARTIAPDQVPESGNLAGDQNLMSFVDSFGLVQILMAIEEEIGLELDFTKVDLGSITHVEDLALFISTEAAPGDGPSVDERTKNRVA